MTGTERQPRRHRRFPQIKSPNRRRDATWIGSAARDFIVGNRKAREFMLQQEHAARIAEEERARTRPRAPGFDSHTGGIGLLRLQLIVLPSFEDTHAWEIRQDQQQWCLCKPQVVQPGPELVGYDQVPFESNRLQEFSAE